MSVLLFPVISGLAAAGQVHDDTHLRIVRVEHVYEVAGASLGAAQDGLFEARGDAMEGAMADVSVSYTTSSTSTACRLHDYEIGVTLTIDIPDWPGAATASDGARARFAETLALMQAHEEGHAEITLAGAQRMASRFADLGDMADCEALEATLARIVQSEAAWIDENQSAYEIVTRRGVDQALAAHWTPSPAPAGP